MEQQAFWQGIEEFNRGEYYACHDTLEALWMEAIEPDKTFYQGILQIAVALYHRGNGNCRGAMILLGEGMNRLRRYPPDYHDLDVAALIAEAEQLLYLLQQQSIQPDPTPITVAAPVIRCLTQPDETLADDRASKGLST